MLERGNDAETRQTEHNAGNAIHRTLAVLERMAASPSGLSITELADGLALNKATIFRILASLQSAGYVEQEQYSQRYRLTLKIAVLAFSLIDTMGFEEICQPYLDELARETGELCQLAVVQGNDMIFVAKAEGNQRVKVVPLMGRRVALHASGGGKVWLASLPDADALRIVMSQSLPQLTERTLTTAGALLQEWEQVRRQGYATVVQEYWDDVNSVGAPVRSGRGGQVVAAISVAGPANRFTVARLHELAPQLIAAADSVGRVWPQWREPVSGVRAEE
ncbi:MAG: IclR family transcriptional regulator [Chloroflexi bacterium]|nr:IclR family transcriptional regulator [Chloroflexota bacterium]